MAIKNFKHKGLKSFFENGEKSGIQAAHAKKIARLLDRLDAVAEIRDINFPGADFHPLSGNLRGWYSIHVNGNWTIIFRFSNGEVIDVDLTDYH